MSKIRSFIIYWLPVLLWIALIFCASGDPGSFQHSSRIIEPIVRWLFPHISAHTVRDIVFGVRKCAHLTEFAIMALLVWRALRKPVKNDPRPWQWPVAIRSLLLVMLYAASDEFHQLLVPSRQASLIDVLIDTSGGGAGILLLWLVGRFAKQW